jgi:DNA-binding response OmpR family regulator
MMQYWPQCDSGPSLHGARVLIVEDDILLRMELEFILREAGAEIAGSCRTVNEGLAVAANGPIAAAILDIRVGRETVDPIVDQLINHGTPFMFYTGQAENDANLEKWAGRTVLSKPARPEAIVAAVANLLR